MQGSWYTKQVNDLMKRTLSAHRHHKYRAKIHSFFFFLIRCCCCCCCSHCIVDFVYTCACENGVLCYTFCVECENRYYSFENARMYLCVCEWAYSVARAARSVSNVCVQVFVCTRTIHTLTSPERLCAEVYVRIRTHRHTDTCTRRYRWTRKMTKTKIIKNYFPQFSNRWASEHNHLLPYCARRYFGTKFCYFVLRALLFVRFVGWCFVFFFVFFLALCVSAWRWCALLHLFIHGIFILWIVNKWLTRMRERARTFASYLEQSESESKTTTTIKKKKKTKKKRREEK